VLASKVNTNAVVMVFFIPVSPKALLAA